MKYSELRTIDAMIDLSGVEEGSENDYIYTKGILTNIWFPTGKVEQDPQQYVVKLSEVNQAKPDQQLCGYLANFNVVCHYDKKEATKKARMFGGVIEKAFI